MRGADLASGRSLHLLGEQRGGRQYAYILETKIQASSNFIARKMKFSIKDFFSKCDQVRSSLRIWSHLLKKSLMEKFYFLCSVFVLRLFLCGNKSLYLTMVLSPSTAPPYLKENSLHILNLTLRRIYFLLVLLKLNNVLSFQELDFLVHFSKIFV